MNLPKVTLDYLDHKTPEGQRNSALFDAAGQLRDAGASEGDAMKRKDKVIHFIDFETLLTVCGVPWTITFDKDGSPSGWNVDTHARRITCKRCRKAKKDKR